VTRPAGIPDPRESIEFRSDDPAEDKLRSRVAIGDLMANALPDRTTYTYLDFHSIRASIPPERWDELKRRFVLILAALRERRDYGGE
jgi:hypothetical protein